MSENLNLPAAAASANALTPAQAVAKLGEWAALAAHVKSVTEEERTMRKAIFSVLFPSPKEGTNRLEIGNGYTLIGKYPVDRKVDEGVLQVMKPKLAEARIMVDAVVKYEPSFAKAVYNTFTEEQKALFDQCLIIKPGSISMEIQAPKEPKK
jgi:hypothetical protein